MDRKVREQDFTVNRKVKASCMSVPECWEVAGEGCQDLEVDQQSGRSKL